MPMTKILLPGILLLIISASLAPAQAPSGDDTVATESARGTAGTIITVEQNVIEAILFYVFATLTVVASLGVVLAGNIVRMAMWLFAAFGAIAMLFFLLQAHFLGAVQLVVYSGGILVLIVFGIMLTSSSPWVKFDIKRGELLASGGACLLLFAVISHFIYHAKWVSTPQVEMMTMHQFGHTLLTDYLVPFEVASVLLLVVMIGAAYLAKQVRRR